MTKAHLAHVKPVEISNRCNTLEEKEDVSEERGKEISGEANMARCKSANN